MAATTASSRLIGRQDELAALRGGLEEACAGRPSLAFVAGESGVGKTRLLDELADLARAAGARVIVGECVELGEGELPFAPLVGALRPLARAGDPALLGLPPVTRATLAALLPDLADADGGVPAEALEDRRDAQPRMFEALLAAIARLGDEAPLLLVVEDLHWADRSTRDFLSFLGRNLLDERLLVALSYRPDELHRRHPLRPLLATLERTPGARRVELGGLSRDAVAEMARETLGSDPGGELVDRVHRRSEGNPLFVQELLAAGHGPLPPSLADALMVRVERLPPAAQEVVRVLAAAQPAEHALLEELAEIDGATLRQALRDAIAGHVVVVADDDRYAFRHVLLREVVYDDLLPGERAALHLAVARALEARLAQAPDDAVLATAIAHHFHAAGDQPQALRSAIRAAEAGMRMHASGDAAALLERALELWERVPDPDALTGMDHVELLWRTAQALRRAGEDPRRLTIINEALREVRAADPDDRRVAALLRERAISEWQLGRGEASRKSLDLARRLLPEDASVHERIELTMARIKLASLQARFSEAIALSEDALAEESLTDGQRAEIYNNIGHNLIRAGEHDRGVALLREAMTIDTGWGRADRIGITYGNLADALQLRGHAEEAAEMVDEGLRMARPEGRGWSYLLALGAELAIQRGDFPAARDYLRRVGRTNGNARVNVALRRAELALATGDDDGACGALDEAESLLVDSLEPQLVAVAGVLRAELARRTGDLDRARGAVEAALERVEFCSDDTVRIGRLAATGVAVEADAAQRARDLGRLDDAAAAIARSEVMLSRAQATGEAGPLEAALRTTAEAHHLRALDEPAAQVWIAAAEAWDALGRPLAAATAWWRAAESCLARGERESAAAALREGLALARPLDGASWVVDELEALAARGRLPLDDAAHESAAEAASEADDDPFGLTPRERQVLRLVASGATNREIGAELFMAEKTASVHVSRILAKLDVRSRTEAAAVAHRLGLT